MQTVVLDSAEPHDIDRAVEILANGGLVGMPSETVYGLAADASRVEAVQKVFAAKGRPIDHPLILHVASVDEARAASGNWTATAETLARTFWPGPLTVVVEKSDRVDSVVTGGQASVAVRVPDHPVFLYVLRELSRRGSIGVAAPSANRFGHVSATTVRHVLEDLDGVIDAVVDAGPTSVGVESTIVDCTVDPPRVLRPGGVSTEDIDAALLLANLAPTDSASGPGSQIRVSGMLVSHYAPEARVVLVDSNDEARAMERTLRNETKTAVVIEADTDTRTYARELFSRLRDADSTHPDLILAVLPADVGLGRAVRDRLFKAAAAR